MRFMHPGASSLILYLRDILQLMLLLPGKTTATITIDKRRSYSYSSKRPGNRKHMIVVVLTDGRIAVTTSGCNWQIV